MYGCPGIGMRELEVKVRMRVRHRERDRTRMKRASGKRRRGGGLGMDLGIFFVRFDLSTVDDDKLAPTYTMTTYLPLLSLLSHLFSSLLFFVFSTDS